MRALLKKAALLFLALIVALLAMEFFVRRFYPFYRPDRQIAFRYNEDGIPLGPAGASVRQATPKGDYNLIVSFNAYGFRDPKDLKESTANDLFVLGDSFSFGWGVETADRYSDQLAALLGRRVFNISIPADIEGYAQLMRYAQSHGARIGHVILGVCMENDIRDYTKPRVFVPVHEAQVDRRRVDAIIEAARSMFQRHSALYLALSYTLQSHPAVRRLFERMRISRDIDRLTHKNIYSEPLLESCRDAVLAISTIAPTTVLLIPSRALWHGANLETERRVHDRFVDLLRAANVPVVDMRPVFEESGQPLRFYFATDPHWNEAGHRKAAEALAAHLGQHVP